MCESFIVTCTDNDKVEIDEFHINFWHFSHDHTIIDIGLLVELDASLMLKDELSFEFYSPFHYVSGETENLSNLMSKNETLQLIFNDEVKSITNCSSSIAKKSNVIKFKNKKKMILTESSFSESDNEQKINIVIDNKNFDNKTLGTLFENNSIKLYLRFRYKVNRNKTSNIYIDKTFSDEQLLIDFRFNEVRFLTNENSKIYDTIIAIRKVYVFVILPINYSIKLNSDIYLKYIRVLEADENCWVDYIDELKNHKKRFLVYYWKNQLNNNPTNYFNLLVSFKSQTSNLFNKLKFATELGVLSIAFLLIPEFINFDTIINEIITVINPFEFKININRTLINTIIQAVGTIGFTLVLGVTSNAIWDFGKSLIKRSKKQ
ncbi:MAG: hypothetical protein U9O95_00940 [Candidatus Marinimicrobia bacterium]|nr:hypothetical protein [Candidatus Neomarinimicrobiota bacterium]